MSERSKKQIITTVIVMSIFLNLFLIVRVFALKRVSKNYRPHRSPAILQQIVVPPRPIVKEAKPVEKNFVQTVYELARAYEERGHKAVGLHKKMDYYSLALLEYAKLPKKSPYVRLVRQARKRLQPAMLEASNVRIALGDSRRQLEKAYGLPDQKIVDPKYFPLGVVSYYHYDKKGLVVGISCDRVFSIKLGSEFSGSWHGIGIDDHFDKLSTLYPGRRIDSPGNHFAYEADDLNTTFIFVDSDERLDAMKIYDQQYHGEWKFALR